MESEDFFAFSERSSIVAITDILIGFGFGVGIGDALGGGIVGFGGGVVDLVVFVVQGSV